MKSQIIDTNVLITANKAVKCEPDDDILNYPKLIETCIISLLAVKNSKNSFVTLDIDDEIFTEYKKHLNFSGQPGVGDFFFKWLHDHRWGFPSTERIALHKTEDGYEEFPLLMKPLAIDRSDMKFFAVSNGHPDKPPILEATDSKWWHWADTAKKCGITIKFMDEQYMHDQINDQ